MTKMKIVLSVVLIGLLTFGVGMGSFAWFTSQATSEENVFETGTLEIGVPEGNDGVTAFISGANWAPGSTVTETIDVSNLGSLDFKYKVSASRVAEADTQDEADSTYLYDKLEVVVSDGDGELYNGSLSGLIDVLCDAGLASGASETLTITVTLPTDADNTYQGIGTTIQFTFDATQTANSGWTE